MQIVIDITEEQYYFIKTHTRQENPIDIAILNGKPIGTSALL